MNHIEFAQTESAMLETKWDRNFSAFLDDVAYATGLTDEYGPGSLDGNRAADNENPDAACLDELHEWFESGMSPFEASQIIKDRQYDAAWRDPV